MVVNRGNTPKVKIVRGWGGDMMNSAGNTGENVRVSRGQSEGIQKKARKKSQPQEKVQWGQVKKWEWPWAKGKREKNLT